VLESKDLFCYSPGVSDVVLLYLDVVLSIHCIVALYQISLLFLLLQNRSKVCVISQHFL